MSRSARCGAEAPPAAPRASQRLAGRGLSAASCASLGRALKAPTPPLLLPPEAAWPSGRRAKVAGAGLRRARRPRARAKAKPAPPTTRTRRRAFAQRAGLERPALLQRLCPPQTPPPAGRPGNRERQRARLASPATVSPPGPPLPGAPSAGREEAARPLARNPQGVKPLLPAPSGARCARGGGHPCGWGSASWPRAPASPCGASPFAKRPVESVGLVGVESVGPATVRVAGRRALRTSLEQRAQSGCRARQE